MFSVNSNPIIWTENTNKDWQDYHRILNISQITNKISMEIKYLKISMWPSPWWMTDWMTEMTDTKPSGSHNQKQNPIEQNKTPPKL